jgi:hypothetical protein
LLPEKVFFLWSFWQAFFCAKSSLVQTRCIFIILYINFVLHTFFFTSKMGWKIFPFAFWREIFFDVFREKKISKNIPMYQQKN